MIEQADTTISCRPGQRGTVDDYLNICIDVRSSAAAEPQAAPGHVVAHGA